MFRVDILIWIWVIYSKISDQSQKLIEPCVVWDNPTTPHYLSVLSLYTAAATGQIKDHPVSSVAFGHHFHSDRLAQAEFDRSFGWAAGHRKLGLHCLLDTGSLGWTAGHRKLGLHCWTPEAWAGLLDTGSSGWTAGHQKLGLDCWAPEARAGLLDTTGHPASGGGGEGLRDNLTAEHNKTIKPTE